MSTMVDDGKLGIILLNEINKGYEIDGFLMYNLKDNQCYLACELIVKEESIWFSSIYLKATPATWLEYNFSEQNKSLTAVAVHDSIPGTLKKAYFDFNNTGKMNSFLEYDSDQKTIR